MSILITVCARGGSKGIPGKNIKILNYKPLIYYTLKLADEFAQIHPETYIYLSTDSKDIKKVVEDLNIETVKTNYSRPDQLATDASGKMSAIKDVKDFAEKDQSVNFDFVLDLDVTSPLRTIKDIEESFEKLSNNVEALNIFSVSPANRNPYFNMVEEKKDGFFELCKEGNFLSRQTAPAVYDMNASFYIFKEKYFKGNYNSVITEQTLIYNVPHICFDLDEPIEFEFMEFLLSENKLNFDFIQ